MTFHLGNQWKTHRKAMEINGKSCVFFQIRELTHVNYPQTNSGTGASTNDDPVKSLGIVRNDF